IATRTRPDIAFHTSQLARLRPHPTRAHLQAAWEVVRYLYGTRDRGIIIGPRNTDQRELTIEADAALHLQDVTKDRTAFVATIHGSPIAWKAKTERSLAESSCEAEIKAVELAHREGRWIQDILRFLGLTDSRKFTIYTDSQPTLDILE